LIQLGAVAIAICRPYDNRFTTGGTTLNLYSNRFPPLPRKEYQVNNSGITKWKATTNAWL